MPMVSFILSESDNGRCIVLADTSTLIHTVPAGSGGNFFTELWISCCNTHNADVALTLQWGGTTDPDDCNPKEMNIPKNCSPILIIPGLRLCGGVLLKGFGSVPGKLNITGYANRFTP